MPAPFDLDAASIDARVDDLVRLLPLDQKVGQLVQRYPSAAGLDDSIRQGHTGSVLFVSDPEQARRLQRIAVEESPHGIPLLFGFDVVHGFRTVFPVPIGLAATWCPDTVRRSQYVAAREARAAGVQWTFAPMLDIARDPRWGRMVEGAGEDPVLGAAMAAAQVAGFQSDLDRDGVLATAKHFVGYGAARGGRDYEEAELSESELWNVYLPPFRAAIDAGVGSVMSSYTELNGVPAAADRALLTGILRGLLGFDGVIVSDSDAVRSLETQRLARDEFDAAVRAFDAGIGVEMAWAEPAYRLLPAAVEAGLVSESTIDEAVRRVLRAKLRLGLFERPFPDAQNARRVLEDPTHREQARIAAERSLVLLTNDGLLPLSPAAGDTVAVIGQLAASARDTLGPWVFAHDSAETTTILDGLRRRLGDTVTTVHAPGAGIPRRRTASPFDGMDPTEESTPAGYDDDAAIARAVEVAAAADVAVVVVGQRQNQIGEKASVASLDLPGRQLEQLQRIVATGTPTVAVLFSGRPLDLSWAVPNVPAIVAAWYPGTRGGEAVAGLLLGDFSPAGRLPFTWPAHVGQVPMVSSHYRTFAPQDAASRFVDDDSEPQFVFGHGLSYAAFEYSSLRSDRDELDEGEAATIAVEVTNTSERDADEVVQLYLHQRYGRSVRPVRELKDFRRVHIPGGATRTVEFSLAAQSLEYWSSQSGGIVRDSTEIDVGVGGDSRCELPLRLRVVGGHG